MNWWKMNGFDLSEDFELCEIWVKPYFVFMVAGNDIGEGFGLDVRKTFLVSLFTLQAAKMILKLAAL